MWCLWNAATLRNASCSSASPGSTLCRSSRNSAEPTRLGPKPAGSDCVRLLNHHQVAPFAAAFQSLLSISCHPLFPSVCLGSLGLRNFGLQHLARATCALAFQGMRPVVGRMTPATGGRHFFLYLEPPPPPPSPPSKRRWPAVVNLIFFKASAVCPAASRSSLLD